MKRLKLRRGVDLPKVKAIKWQGLSLEYQANIICSHWSFLSCGSPWSLPKLHDAEVKTNGVVFLKFGCQLSSDSLDFHILLSEPTNCPSWLTLASMCVPSKRSITSLPLPWPWHPIARRLKSGRKVWSVQDSLAPAKLLCSAFPGLLPTPPGMVFLSVVAS